MTNLEALQAVLLPIQTDAIITRKALIDFGISGSATYNGGDMVRTIDRAAVVVLEALLSAPDVTEGGYTAKYDRKSIIERIDMITKRISETGEGLVPKPKIKNRTNRW